MFEQELDIGLKAARAAGAIQLRRRDHITGIEIKSDNSPVTAIDKECESVIIDSISQAFPHDGFLGEETGLQQGTSGRRWIIDPLDGTRPYIKGIPTYSSLIALYDGDTPAVGIIHLPGMDITVWASKGNGAFKNGKQVYVSATQTIEKAFGFGYGFIEKFQDVPGKNLLELMRKMNYCYGFMDAYSYACVAWGQADICICLLDKPWDNAAPACIITEAGGKVTDIAGAASIYSGTTIATNGILHDQVLKYFHQP